MSVATCLLKIIDITLCPGFSLTGESLYCPDLSSMRLCGYAPGHASVLGFLEHKTPVIGSDGIASLKDSLCPRGILKRVVEYVAFAKSSLVFNCYPVFVSSHLVMRELPAPSFSSG